MSTRENATEVDLFADEPSAPPTVLDRSTLERWADCPHAAYMIDRKQVSVGGTLLDVGTAVHEIIAKAVKLRNEDGAKLSALREYVDEWAADSRPDIQPEVVQVAKRLYSILSHVTSKPYDSERSPDDLLRYDGGTGDKSGQLAADILPAADDGSRGPIRLTGEVDLMMATPSAEEVEVCDWKSGWKHWTATDVERSFQFQFYAWLVMRNYPQVNVVRFRVFTPRIGSSTSPVEFRRDQMHVIGRRLMSAVEIYLRHHNAVDASDVPAWPNPERCGFCDAAPYCQLAHKPTVDFALDAEAYLRQYVVVAEVESRMKGLLTAAVRKRKSDLVFGDVAFGTEAPKATRAASCKAYSVGSGAEETE